MVGGAQAWLPSFHGDQEASLPMGSSGGAWKCLAKLLPLSLEEVGDCGHHRPS